VNRPKTRAECSGIPRPCPFASCRYSTRVDVKTNQAGSLKVYREDVQESEDEDVAPDTSCALDVADRGEHTLEEIAGIYGCTKENVRLIEEKALEMFRKKLAALGMTEEALYGRRSGVLPEDSEDSTGVMENIQSFMEDMKPLPTYPHKVVEVTADGRRVGDAAPGKIRRRGPSTLGGYSFYQLQAYRRKKRAEGG
jgi:hypothetical protein